MTAIRPVSILLAAFVGALLLSTSPAPAHAQKDAPSAKDMEAAKKAFLEGKAAKEAGKLDEAVEKFKLSYRLSKRPQLLYNIALTLEEMKNVDLALFYYKKYLADAPADDAQRATAEKSVAALEAEVAKRPPPEETPDDGEQPKPKKVKKPKRAYTAEDFQHTLVEDAPPGKPLDITCAIPEDADWTVTLNYRGAGEEKFTPIVMRFRYEEVVARVPAEKVTGNAIQYFIEVHNPAGELITRTGKSTSPNVVYLDAAAKDHYFPDLEETIDKGDDADATDGGNGGRDGDDEDPLGKGRGKGQVDDEDPTRKGGGDDDNDDAPLTRKGAGGSFVLVPDGPGYTDVGSKKFSYVKWGATGGSIGMLTLSMTFYLMASSQSSGLEARALESSMDSCGGGAPCDTYDDELKAIEASGRRSESISKVTFTVGLAAGAVAAYWWHKEIKARKKAERALAVPAAGGGDGEVGLDSVIAVPVAGDDYLGAAAALRF